MWDVNIDTVPGFLNSSCRQASVTSCRWGNTYNPGDSTFQANTISIQSLPNRSRLVNHNATRTYEVEKGLLSAIGGRAKLLNTQGGV